MDSALRGGNLKFKILPGTDSGLGASDSTPSFFNINMETFYCMLNYLKG